MVIAACFGALTGALIIFVMFHIGMLRERSGVAMLLVALASFNPVFAIIEQDWAAVMLHFGILFGFTWVAVQGFQKGVHLLAGGLIGFGFFEAGIQTINAPGPAWWPGFGAAVAAIAGLALIRLLQTNKAPR